MKLRPEERDWGVLGPPSKKELNFWLKAQGRKVSDTQPRKKRKVSVNQPKRKTHTKQVANPKQKRWVRNYAKALGFKIQFVE